MDVQEKSAARRLAETFSAETLDSLIADAMKSGTPIDGADGLLNELTKAVLERSLQAELTHHLGYEAGDPAGRGSGNSRNGSTTKTVNTVNGPVELAVPRDRNGSFEPVIVPKKTRRLSNINSVVLSLSSRGMTTRDIEAHIEEVYGAKVSRELISTITDVVVDEIKAWQSRPLDEVYPILYIDGLRLRIKDNGVVTTKVAYLAIGVDVDGRKHALGCWIQDTEGAKFWQKVVIDLRNRGVHDILIACCDGLTGLPDAIRSIFPDTVVQTSSINNGRAGMVSAFTCTTTDRTCANASPSGSTCRPVRRGGCGAWTGQREQHRRYQRRVPR
jgi:putative transposase